MPLTPTEQESGLKQCENCGQGFDSSSHDGECPWCGSKDHRCEGSSQ